MRRFHAPGRVNLIGDHIDYLGGTVLPMAIDRGTDIWVEPRTDGRLVAFSENFPDVGTITADIESDMPRPDWGWVNYLVAVARVLRQRGLAVPGADVRVRGNIPNGAGLSSSASLELAMAVAIDAIAGGGLSPADLALVGQRAENDLGVACGVMDQMAIAAGVAGHALLIDCGRLTVTPVPFPPDVAVVVADSGQRRELADSAYNERRSACERAQDLVGTRLVDVPADAVDGVLKRLPATLQPVARHVMTEQIRVVRFAAALRADDRRELGALMRASHLSLRDDFGVTGSALDALAEMAWEAPGVIGARMTGAGFGGCTVNLVDPARLDEFMATVGRGYAARTGATATFYPVAPADGAHEVPA